MPLPIVKIKGFKATAVTKLGDLPLPPVAIAGQKIAQMEFMLQSADGTEIKVTLNGKTYRKFVTGDASKSDYIVVIQGRLAVGTEADMLEILEAGLTINEPKLT